MNLPICGVALAAIAVFLDIPQQQDVRDKSLKWKLRQLDFPGTILVAAGAICILLALQWGGQSYPVSIRRTAHYGPLSLACSPV